MAGFIPILISLIKFQTQSSERFSLDSIAFLDSSASRATSYATSVLLDVKCKA